MTILAVAAVALWGLYLAIGGLRSEVAARGVVVGAAFLLFLGFWLSLLALHARRQRKKREASQRAQEETDSAADHR
jgi:hypothetical protein